MDGEVTGEQIGTSKNTVGALEWEHPPAAALSVTARSMLEACSQVRINCFGNSSYPGNLVRWCSSAACPRLSAAQLLAQAQPFVHDSMQLCCLSTPQLLVHDSFAVMHASALAMFMFGMCYAGAHSSARQSPAEVLPMPPATMAAAAAAAAADARSRVCSAPLPEVQARYASGQAFALMGPNADAANADAAMKFTSFSVLNMEAKASGTEARDTPPAELSHGVSNFHQHEQSGKREFGEGTRKVERVTRVTRGGWPTARESG
eukprot:1158349-Pelagomonas_calceolata.AAC.4